MDMTYNSKRTITSMIAGVFLFAAYILFALPQYQNENTDMRFWAVAILVFVGIGVVTAAVVQLIFHMIFAVSVAIRQRHQSENDVERMITASVIEDERDKLISLKSTQAGYVVIGAGFIAALAALALGASGTTALHIVLASFAVGSFMEGGIRVYLYERGVHNG